MLDLGKEIGLILVSAGMTRIDQNGSRTQSVRQLPAPTPIK